MGELSGQSYLVALTFPGETNDDLGVLGGIVGDACDLVESHWRVKAEVVGTNIVRLVDERIALLESNINELSASLERVTDECHELDRKRMLMLEAASRLRPLARRAITEPGASGDEARADLKAAIDWLAKGCPLEVGADG